jgi:hypothetical protein
MKRIHALPDTTGVGYKRYQAQIKKLFRRNDGKDTQGRNTYRAIQTKQKEKPQHHQLSF